MKKYCKTYLMILIILCFSMMHGCSKPKVKESTPAPLQKGTETIVPEATNQPTVTETPKISLPVAKTKEISIYAINSDKIEKEAVSALIPEEEEITPQLIVNMVVDAMADESFMIGIDEVKTDKDTVIVSFLADQPPVVNVGSSAEGEILDAIAQSLLDNLDHYKKVVFQIMGGGYVTGHFEFESDYVYLEKSN